MRNGVEVLSPRRVSESPWLGSVIVIFVFPRALGSWNKADR